MTYAHPVFASILSAVMLIAANSPQTGKPAAATAAGVTKQVFLANIDREFDAIDADKDKKVSKAELEQHRRTLAEVQRNRRNLEAFGRLDTDKNGVISQQEFLQAAPAAPKINVEPLFARVDANRDQTITAAEYRAGAESEFAQRDSNKDGVLSPNETRTPKK